MTARLSGGASAPVRPLIFADMLPRERGTEGEQMGMATTRLCTAGRGGYAARRCTRLDTETAGQIEARLEANMAEWHKAIGLGNGRAASAQACGALAVQTRRLATKTAPDCTITFHLSTGHVLFML